MRGFRCAALAALTLLWAPAEGAVIAFTDEAAYNAELAGRGLFVEGGSTFDGPAVNYGPNSTGGALGGGVTLDVFGHDGDPSTQGLDGNGNFAFELDSGGADAVFVGVNLPGPTFAFSLRDITSATGGNLNAEELAFRVDTTDFLSSDILGLTNSSDGAFVGDQPTTIAFLGFVSDVAVSNFFIGHGDLVAPGGVSGSFENVDIGALELSQVPLPPAAALLGMGVGLLLLRRRRGG